MIFEIDSKKVFVSDAGQSINKNKDSIVVESAKSILKRRIKIIFEDSRKIYGSHRIQKKLERELEVLLSKT